MNRHNRRALAALGIAAPFVMVQQAASRLIVPERPALVRADAGALDHISKAGILPGMGAGMMMAGGAAVSPFHWNPSDKDAGTTLSESNLRFNSGTGYTGVRSDKTLAQMGGGATKLYFEFEAAEVGNGTLHMGIVTSGWDLGYISPNSTGVGVWFEGGYIFSNGANGTTYSPAATVGQKMGFAIDVTANKIWAHVQGTWWNSGNPDAGTGNVTWPAGYSALSLSHYVAGSGNGTTRSGRIRTTQNYTTNLTGFTFIPGG